METFGILSIFIHVLTLREGGTHRGKRIRVCRAYCSSSEARKMVGIHKVALTAREQALYTYEFQASPDVL